MMLKGKKSYISAAALVIIAGLSATGLITPELTKILYGFFGGVGIFSLRAAISGK